MQAICLLSVPAVAGSGSPFTLRADSHAPIGVMRDHTHKVGELMLSYRFMHMDMAGNAIGVDDVTPDEIVTAVPNIFPGPPALRIVPVSMRMDMHMFGLMSAPTDWLTLMVMSSYLQKEMDHITFQGIAGTTRLGTFATRSEGLGDVSVSGLIPLLRGAHHHLQLNVGIGLPAGAIDETGRILTPADTRPAVRLPYPTQIGSGTVDTLPGLTYTGHSERIGWGAQYTGVFISEGTMPIKPGVTYTSSQRGAVISGGHGSVRPYASLARPRAGSTGAIRQSPVRCRRPTPTFRAAIASHSDLA